MEAEKVREINKARELLIKATTVLDNMKNDGYRYDTKIFDIMVQMENIEKKLSEIAKLPEE